MACYLKSVSFRQHNLLAICLKQSMCDSPASGLHSACRFNTSVQFGLPNEACRAEILGMYAQHLSAEDLAALAAVTQGLAGRDLKDLSEQAERSWASKVRHATRLLLISLFCTFVAQVAQLHNWHGCVANGCVVIQLGVSKPAWYMRDVNTAHQMQSFLWLCSIHSCLDDTGN